MKIKDIWNKFLELRKSPTCITVSIIGLLDIVFWAFYLLFITIGAIFFKPFEGSQIVSHAFVLYLIYIAYMLFRINGFWLYTAGLLLIFIVEKLFKIKIEKNFVKDSPSFKIIYVIGIIAFIFGCMLSFYIYATGAKNIWLVM